MRRIMYIASLIHHKYSKASQLLKGYLQNISFARLSTGVSMTFSSTSVITVSILPQWYPSTAPLLHLTYAQHVSFIKSIHRISPSSKVSTASLLHQKYPQHLSFIKSIHNINPFPGVPMKTLQYIPLSMHTK
jgi:hypothetical protein